LVAAFADRLIIADVEEGIVGASRQGLGRVVKAGAFVEANADVVIAQLKGVTKEEIEERGGRFVGLETILRIKSIERSIGGVDKVLDVIAAIICVSADELRFRERHIVNHAAFELVMARIENEVEDRWILAARVAQARELAASIHPFGEKDDRVDETAESAEHEAVEDRLETLGVALRPLDGTGMQSDNIEQHCMRIAGLADERYLREFRPKVRVDT
jgi:hypothetical protein